MLLHKQISLFSHSLNFGFLNLLDCINFIIFFWCRSKNLWEVSRTNMLKFWKLIQSNTLVLLLFICLLLRFNRLGIAILFCFAAVYFMSGPMFFLALFSTIINLFASSTFQKLLFMILTNFTTFLHFF